jgi:hypothetical protein
MNDKTYNGWTNYETWRVNLEVIDGLDAREYFSCKMENADQLATMLKEYAERVIFENGEIDPNSTGGGYVIAFLDRVNWREIASFWADEYELFQTE